MGPRIPLFQLLNVARKLEGSGKNSPLQGEPSTIKWLQMTRPDMRKRLQHIRPEFKQFLTCSTSLLTSHQLRLFNQFLVPMEMRNPAQKTQTPIQMNKRLKRSE